MKATESEPELHVRGMVMARGNYTPAEIREFSRDEMMFVYHYQNVQEDRLFDRFSYLMGITWDVEEVKKMKDSSSKGKPSGKLFYPLTTLIRPELLDHIRKTQTYSGTIAQGDYVKEANEVVLPMSDLSKDEFLALIGRGKRKPAPPKDAGG